MIIVRWANTRNYITSKFVDNLEVNFAVQQQIFAGNVLEQLNNDQRKLIAKYLVYEENISNYKYYIIEIRTPYVENGQIVHTLKTLNKTNISLSELVYELKLYESALEIRNREIAGVKATKKVVEVVIERNNLELKKPWWKVW